MQRIVFAMLAMASFIISNPAALQAQKDGHAAEPGTHPIDVPIPGANLPDQHAGPALTIARGQTVDSVTESGRDVMIAGHVKHDVDVTDLTLTIEKGAAIGGVVHAVNCTVHNHAGDSVTVIARNAHVPAQAAATAQIGVGAKQAPSAKAAKKRPAKPRSWFESQLALLLLGLMGAFVAVNFTPQASRRVADHVAAEPKRDLRIGLCVGFGFFSVLVINAILLNLPLIRLVWAPFGAMVFFIPMILLGFGWVAAMRNTGNYVAKKLNSRSDSTHFGRMALGVFAFFVLNVVLGSISRTLGILSLGVELCLALAGLGATVVIACGKGFGRGSTA